ncbi:MAG TPA: flagellar hook capping FlgD N-terminal domain-containing protein [Bacteroidota bacterium]|nr:flagellar hook capping FlgD N-terminal domain-containing protein [Bacteroidota bacterium]
MATQVTAVGPTQFPASTSAQGMLGKDDFLKLLVSQLQNQDPLNPMDGTQFASQLAQFTSVEQLANINTTLQSNMDASKLLNQSISNALSTTVIGKEVRATGTSFNYAGSGEMRLGYTLPSAALSAQVKIVDQTGNVVRTITGTGVAAGDSDLQWDGLTDSGAQAAAGKYTVQVSASDTKGNALSATPYFYGTVTGVRFKSTGAVFVVDGMEINLSDILEVSQG